MSSDDDYSAGSVASYVSFLNGIKPPFPNGASSWLVNYIGSLALTSQCQQFVNVGTRYVQLAQASSGLTVSVCNTDWSTTMADVQIMISQLLTDYYLSAQPNPTTIVVTVNGATVAQDPTNGWTLKSNGTGPTAQWYIQFNGTGIPQLYSVVKVSFTPASAK